MESSCVVFAFIENYSTSKPLKDSLEKSHILNCEIFVASERYNTYCFPMVKMITRRPLNMALQCVPSVII